MVGTVTSKGSAAAGSSNRARPAAPSFPRQPWCPHLSLRGLPGADFFGGGKLPANPRESPRAPREHGQLALHFPAGDRDFFEGAGGENVQIPYGSGPGHRGVQGSPWLWPSELQSVCERMTVGRELLRVTRAGGARKTRISEFLLLCLSCNSSPFPLYNSSSTPFSNPSWARMWSWNSRMT